MKQFGITLLFTVLMSMIAIKVSAHDIEAENADGVTIYYVWTNNNTELAVSCRGWYENAYDNEYSGNVVIPESVTYQGNTYSVTSINRNAFYFCRDLTSVSIPKSVSFIGSSAFSYCSSLTSVTIPNGVSSINDYVFDDCSNLTSVTIPNSVTSIGYKAFSGCSNLASVTIPNSVTSIDSDAFSGTAWYNNQPDGVVYAGKVLYKYKGTMPEDTNISIDEGTLGIAAGAFQNCTGLVSVAFPNSLTSINRYAFYYCRNLASITLPNSVMFIGPVAFHGTAWYDNQPDGVVYAGKVLYGYKGIMPDGTTINIDEGTLGLVEQAFSGYSGLVSVTIPNSVTSIETEAFSRCSSLTSVTIPNSVTSIGAGAFDGCSSLTSVVIPNSVTSISTAFSESGLTSVEIPCGVTSIDGYAFYGCRGLTSVTIGNSVSSIGESAFERCVALAEIICKATTPPTCGSFAFGSLNKSVCKLYVPKGCLAAYQAADQWSSFSLIEEDESISIKCARPTISYQGGKLKFACETEGVKYCYSLSTPVIESEVDEVSPSTTYTVTVYAKKEGFEDSEPATEVIDIRGLKGDVDGDGKVDITDVTTLVGIILE